MWNHPWNIYWCKRWHQIPHLLSDCSVIVKYLSFSGKFFFFLRCFGEDFACVYACHCCVSALSLLVCSPGIARVKNADAVWLTAGLVVDMKLKDTACLNLVGMCEDVWWKLRPNFMYRIQRHVIGVSWCSLLKLILFGGRHQTGDIPCN